jgi:hypothetical protein
VHRAALVLVAAFLLTGCGIAKEEAAPTRAIVPADLASMEQKNQLGPLGRGLKFNPESSGPENNRQYAKESHDRKDSARTLAKEGRVMGHGLTYSSYSRPNQFGVVEVSLEVELFRTEEAASRYLEKGFREFRRERGRTVDGVKLARVEEFDADTGEEGGGVRATFRIPSRRATLFMTVVAFRRGSVVANALAILRRELIITGDVERIADALDDQIQRVASSPAQGMPAT